MRIITAVCLLLLANCLPAFAADENRLNFASAQGGKDLTGLPGAEVKGRLYFYNVDGNRLTHVLLRVAQAPAGWEARLEPPAREVAYSVDGDPTAVLENLTVEPGELYAASPGQVPAGRVAIPVPGRGFALAKAADLVVSVPAGEPLGSSADFTVEAEASWLGQRGAVAIKQARTFEFTLSVNRDGPPRETQLHPWLDANGQMAGVALAGLALGLVLGLGGRRRPRSG